MRALLKASKLSVVRYRNYITNIVTRGLTNMIGILKKSRSTSDLPNAFWIEIIIGISSSVINYFRIIYRGMTTNAITTQMILTMAEVPYLSKLTAWPNLYLDFAFISCFCFLASFSISSIGLCWCSSCSYTSSSPKSLVRFLVLLLLCKFFFFISGSPGSFICFFSSII